MNLCVIPARGGSKRIPRKNIRAFCGKPMIAWSIEAAIQSTLFDHIIVSTDDEEIATIAKSFGAEVPFCRPVDLADDQTPTRPVVNHAIREAERYFGKAENVCCVYATAPFIRIDDLRHGLELLRSSGADFTFTVTRYSYPIQRALKLTSSGRVRMFHPEYSRARSQDLEVSYHDAGQFYWGRKEAFVDGRDAFSGDSIPIVIPDYLTQDIDTEEDWLRATWLMRAQLLS